MKYVLFCSKRRILYTKRMQDETSIMTLPQELGQGISTPEINLEALMPLIITSTAITILLALLFLIYVSFNTIRRFKVEKATLEMQKDIRRMRELMEQGSTLPASHGNSTSTSKDLLATTQSIATEKVNPAENREVAAIESGSSEQSA